MHLTTIVMIMLKHKVIKDATKRLLNVTFNFVPIRIYIELLDMVDSFLACQVILDQFDSRVRGLAICIACLCVCVHTWMHVCVCVCVCVCMCMCVCVCVYSEYKCMMRVM